ncbi:MAG: hypothetical protein Q8P33_01895 [bacterium]|nr:hypothetical protein [bacterium]
MKKLTGVGKLIFIIAGTALAGVAGMLLGEKLGGTFGCSGSFIGLGNIDCGYLYGLVGLAVGFVLTLLLGFMLKKALAIVILVVVLALAAFFFYAPPVIEFN